MISYLLERYYFIAIAMTPILIVAFFLAEMEKFVLQAFVWSGLAAVYVTHLFFQRQNLWVLYKNMRLPEVPLLGLCLVSFEVIAIFSIVRLSEVLS